MALIHPVKSRLAAQPVCIVSVSFNLLIFMSKYKSPIYLKLLIVAHLRAICSHYVNFTNYSLSTYTECFGHSFDNERGLSRFVNISSL